MASAASSGTAAIDSSCMGWDLLASFGQGCVLSQEDKNPYLGRAALYCVVNIISTQRS
jgi:hypothetical protein